MFLPVSGIVVLFFVVFFLFSFSLFYVYVIIWAMLPEIKVVMYVCACMYVLMYVCSTVKYAVYRCRQVSLSYRRLITLTSTGIVAI